MGRGDGKSDDRKKPTVRRTEHNSVFYVVWGLSNASLMGPTQPWTRDNRHSTLRFFMPHFAHSSPHAPWALLPVLRKHSLISHIRTSLMRQRKSRADVFAEACCTNISALTECQWAPTTSTSHHTTTCIDKLLHVASAFVHLRARKEHTSRSAIGDWEHDAVSGHW